MHKLPTIQNYRAKKRGSHNESNNNLTRNYSDCSFGSRGLNLTATSLLAGARNSLKKRHVIKDTSIHNKSYRKLQTDIETPRKKGQIKTDQLTAYELSEIMHYPEVFYYGEKSVKLSVSKSFDDQEHFYKLLKGDHLAYRYEVVKIIGKGSFGQVCEAWDHKKKTAVAVKVLRNNEKVTTQGAVEIQLLETLRLENCTKVVKLIDNFMFRDHLCLVFELLHKSIYDLLRETRFRGVSAKSVFIISKQILTALKSMRSLDIIHCDLKPENIMIASLKRSGIRIIDFGSGCFAGKAVFAYIQSRFYRAPEVVLGIDYGMAIDIWSFGCILYELFIGVPLFPAEDEFELLSMIVEVIGNPPDTLLENSRRGFYYFENAQLKTSPNCKLRLPRGRVLEELCSCPLLMDLIQKCLHWDPMSRITPVEAARHEFFIKHGNKAV